MWKGQLPLLGAVLSGSRGFAVSGRCRPPQRLMAPTPRALAPLPDGAPHGWEALEARLRWGGDWKLVSLERDVSLETGTPRPRPPWTCTLTVEAGGTRLTAYDDEERSLSWEG